MFYTDFTGRLGVDSELRTSKSGKQYVSMRVASNDYVNGENVTNWVNVTWPGERAIKMQEHMKKGSFIHIHGTLKASLYDNKNGEKAISFDVLADRVDFVSSGSSANTQSNEAVAEAPKKVAEVPKISVEANANDGDDLPF